MNMMVIIIEMATFAGLFTAIVFIAYASGKQQTAAGIHNYPPDIQEEYFKGMLFPGIVFALIPASFVGLIVMMFGR